MSRNGNRWLLIALLATFNLMSACSWRRGFVYEIPEDFRGWVRIDFRVPECPELRKVVSISAAGTACTSSSPEQGWAVDEFYLVGKTRTRVYEGTHSREGLVWGRTVEKWSAPGQGERTYMLFFLGSRKDFEQAAEPPALPGDGDTSGDTGPR